MTDTNGNVKLHQLEAQDGYRHTEPDGAPCETKLMIMNEQYDADEQLIRDLRDELIVIERYIYDGMNQHDCKVIVTAISKLIARADKRLEEK